MEIIKFNYEDRVVTCEGVVSLPDGTTTTKTLTCIWGENKDAPTHEKILESYHAYTNRDSLTQAVIHQLPLGLSYIQKSTHNQESKTYNCSFGQYLICFPYNENEDKFWNRVILFPLFKVDKDKKGFVFGHGHKVVNYHGIVRKSEAYKV